MDYTDQVSNSVLGNSFIANVNTLVNKMDTLEAALGVPNEVAKTEASVQAVADEIDQVYQNTVAAKNTAQRILTDTQVVRDDVELLRDKTLGIFDQTMATIEKQKEILLKINQQIKHFEADMLIANGVENCESFFKARQDLESGTQITVHDFRYAVGRKTLVVSYQGSLLYRHLHYKEIGPRDSMSSTIQLLFPLPEGAVLHFYNISSSMAETAYVHAQQLAKELDLVDRRVQRNLTKSINTAEVVAQLTDQMRVYLNKFRCYCNAIGLSNKIQTVDSADQTGIPSTDGFFVYVDGNEVPVMGNTTAGSSANTPGEDIGPCGDKCSECSVQGCPRRKTPINGCYVCTHKPFPSQE